MTTLLRNLAVLSLCIAGLGCAANPIKNTEGQTAYTQINLWAADATHLTTNYQLGVLLPVNSQVRIIDTADDGIVLEVIESGETVTIANAERHSGQDIAGIYQRYLSTNPANLSRFSPAEANAIRAGEVNPGMSKQAVLVARGYPPAHKTPSTDADDWRYWVTRFNTRVVSFNNGRVSDIQD